MEKKRKELAFEARIQELETKYKALYGLPFSEDVQDRMVQELYGGLIEIRETKEKKSKECGFKKLLSFISLSDPSAEIPVKQEDNES